MNVRWPHPLLIAGDNLACVPEQIRVGAPPFTELELQRLLEQHPFVLPVAQFDQLFGPAICIGREVATDAGPIDLLYASPSGHLTLVETKLWRSPEARRTVVAQIIDYTKHVVRWTYEDLESRFQKYAAAIGSPLNTLYEYVNDNSGYDVDESEFYDRITTSLRQGRLLLLIVGDGIREGLEEMASFLQETPNLQFTLGLVEMSSYRVDHAGERCLLLVPHIVAKTAEITRAVVQIEVDEALVERVKTTVRTPSETVMARPTSLSEREFYDHLAKAQGKRIAEKTGEFVQSLMAAHSSLDQHVTLHTLKIRMRLPQGAFAPRPLLDIIKTGAIRVGIEMLEAIDELGLSDEVSQAFLQRMSAIDPGLLPAQNDDGRWIRKKSGPKNLSDVVPRFAELSKTISDFIEAIQSELDAQTK